MILSFWWMSLEWLRESLRWIDEGGAKDPAVSRFWEEPVRDGPFRKLAAMMVNRCLGTEKLSYLQVRDSSPSPSLFVTFLVAMVSFRRWIVACSSSSRASVVSFSLMACARSAS